MNSNFNVPWIIWISPAVRILIFTITIALPTHYRCFCAHLPGSWKSLALNLCIWMVRVLPSPKNLHLNDDGFPVNKKAGEGVRRRDSTAKLVRVPAHGPRVPCFNACPSVDSRTSSNTDLCVKLWTVYTAQLVSSSCSSSVLPLQSAKKQELLIYFYSFMYSMH